MRTNKGNHKAVQKSNYKVEEGNSGRRKKGRGLPEPFPDPMRQRRSCRHVQDLEARGEKRLGSLYPLRPPVMQTLTVVGPLSFVNTDAATTCRLLQACE